METSTWIVLFILILTIIASIYFSVLTPLFYRCPRYDSCPCRRWGRPCYNRCNYCNPNPNPNPYPRPNPYPQPNRWPINCSLTRYGCCADGRTPRIDPIGSNCVPQPPSPVSCYRTLYGCCPDGRTPRQDYRGKNCQGIYM